MAPIEWKKYEFNKSFITKDEFYSYKQFLVENPNDFPFPKDSFVTMLKQFFRDHKFTTFIIPIGFLLPILLNIFYDVVTGQKPKPTLHI